MKAQIFASAIALATAFSATTADALFLTGTFDVAISQKSPTGNSDDSADATFANAFAATSLGSTIYTGSLNFRTSNSNDSTTVQEWLESGTGSYDLADLGGDGAGTNAVTISNPNVFANPGTALTTWFVFTGTASAAELTFSHDDGIQFCAGTVNVSGTCSSALLVDARAPTSETGAGPVWFSGGDFSLVYAATNGDPSVLEVNAIPLPAAAWLLLGVSGALVTAKRRAARKKAA